MCSCTAGKPIWVKWASDHNVAQVDAYTISKFARWFKRYAFRKVWNQPPARPTDRGTTIPLQLEGLRGQKGLFG